MHSFENNIAMTCPELRSDGAQRSVSLIRIATANRTKPVELDPAGLFSACNKVADPEVVFDNKGVYYQLINRAIGLVSSPV